MGFFAARKISLKTSKHNVAEVVALTGRYFWSLTVYRIINFQTAHKFSDFDTFCTFAMTLGAPTRCVEVILDSSGLAKEVSTGIRARKSSPFLIM